MSNKREVFETPDQRNGIQRHQRRRLAARTRNRGKQTSSHHTSNLPERTRSSARSWKRQELTTLKNTSEFSDLYDEDLDVSDLDTVDVENRLVYYRNNRYPKPSGELTIRTAIDKSDPYILASLFKELKLNSSQYKKQLKRFPRRRTPSVHTMLTDIIVRGDPECIQVVLDSIFHGYIYSTIIDHVCSNGRTALWYASQKGDLDLVRQLIERGHANVNKCGVLIVAAQNGHKHIVDYLLTKGCDPNRSAKNYNERALHAATRRNYFDIVEILLQHGADPFVLDYKKRTPLDYAIHKRHIDIAKLLIDHQCKRFIMSQTGYTPLMLSVDCNNTIVRDMLTSILPEQQVLDEMVLLACHYIIDGNAKKYAVAYSHLERALSRRKPPCSSTPCEAYEFVRECETLDELIAIREDNNKLRMYALVVSERLLLRNDEMNHFLSLLIKQSNFYRWQKNYERCLQIRTHVFEILLKNENKNRRYSKFHKDHLGEVVNILYKILKMKGCVPVHSLELVWQWILNRIDNSLIQLFFKLFFMIIYSIESKKMNRKEQCVLFGLIQRAVRSKIIIENQYPLLNYFTRRFVCGIKEYKCLTNSISTLSIIHLLIHAGADVNGTTTVNKATSLHSVVEYWNHDDAKLIVRILLDANAHLDCIDFRGLRPEELLSDLEIKELLRANRKLSLKCRCAHIIVANNLNYTNYLSLKLIRFVQMHSKETITAYN
ncbi:hypothetical protein I4U23_003488 [Adineta vaga]|nr:hypothetical protein I4U23_003488 [Adineta vaga]